VILNFIHARWFLPRAYNSVVIQIDQKDKIIETYFCMSDPVSDDELSEHDS